jgi:hypothetical protein
MKPITLLIVAGLSLGLLINTGVGTGRQNGKTPMAPSQDTKQQSAEERTINTQQRLNRYFHADVISKLKTCWGNVRGNGTIEFNFTYRKENSSWVSPRLIIRQSTLRKQQNAMALKCMQEAVRSTSFPVQEEDGGYDRFDVLWSFPVPFPKNAEEITEQMFAGRRPGRTGGCDGFGKQPSCLIAGCPNNQCPTQKVCVGMSSCVRDRNGCHGQKCASGGPFGLAGTAIN